MAARSRVRRVLFWSAGAFLFVLVALALLPASQGYDPEPWRKNLAASLGNTTRGPLPPEGGSLVIRNLRMVGRPAPVSLRIEAGRIVRIAELDQDIGAGLQVLDAGGRYAIPGLIDAHVHLSMAPGALLRNDSAEQLAQLRAWHMRAYLTAGVTTIFDPAIDERVALDVRAQLALGHPGPRLLALGPPFSIKDGYVAELFPPGFSEAAEVPAHLDRLMAMKADGVKVPLEPGWVFSIWKLPSAPLLAAIKQGAAVRGLPIYVHAQHGDMYKRALAELSPHAFVHTAETISDDTLAELVKSHAFVVSTLSLFKAQTVMNHPELLDTQQARLLLPPSERETALSGKAQRMFFVQSIALTAPFVPGRLRDVLAAILQSGVGMRAMNHLAAEHLGRTANTLLRMHRAGVPVVLGSDSGNVPFFPYFFHGLTTWLEVAEIERAGFSPAETLQAATLDSARMLNLSREIGALEVGQRADLDILDADPAAGLAAALPSLHWVVHDGIAHTPAEWMAL